MIDLSLVVLHYNRWDLTKDCLASIDAQEIPCSYEKVVVDNGSIEPLPELPTGWRLVRYEENRRHIVGQNRCFESAKGEWVLFVANDVRLEPHCIKSLWLLKNEWSIGQPKLITLTGRTDNIGLQWHWPGYGISERKNGVLVTAFTSTCYLMKKQCWMINGGFDENLETSHEDVDFSLRLKPWEVMTVPVAKAIHLGNATLRHQPSHTRASFHRDRVYVVKKHYVGIDKWIRLTIIGIVDWITSIIHR